MTSVHLNLRVQSLYSKLLGMASSADRHLTRTPISDILKKPCQFKRVWLTHAEAAVRLKQSQVRAAQEQQSKDMELMRRRLHAWLLGSAS
jgi:hypothetical protein